MSMTRLDVGAHLTRVQGNGASLELALGASLTADACFRHEPPTPYEMEQAIDVVEAELMGVRAPSPHGPRLLASGAALRQIADAAEAVSTLSLEAVEALFQRVASESLGHPTARRGLPAGNAFVATLLILREFMHHGGFSSVAFDADSD